MAQAAAVALAILATDARADSVSAPPLRQEWVGAELGAVAVNFGWPTGTTLRVPRFELPIAATVRVARHRWRQLYVTPIQVGVLLAIAGNIPDQLEPRALYLLSEVGWIRRIGPGALELGLGLGVGFVGIAVGATCDGSCVVGGGPWMASPVARYLVDERGSFSWGGFMRAFVPITNNAHFFGNNRGYGLAVTVGLDVAGTGSRR
jgi:hypothetical protein